MTATVTDIFAGAGGSSTGMASVPGIRVVMAANHDPAAVAVHNANHPDTDHACVDLHLEDPRNFPRTTILWASPECTKWSIANNQARALSAEMGGDPSLFDDVPDELVTDDHDEATRSRLLMFDVLRFIEHHRYRFVIVENVVDIATQAKYRRAWESWQRGLRKLGYAYRVVSLNSMHAQALGLPAPQSRDRLYVLAWPAGEQAPDVDAWIRPRAYCPRCDVVGESRQAWKNGRTVGRYRAQYVYVHTTCGTTVEPGYLPAAAAIDWTLIGRRIGDRDKPLADKTRARIAAGIARYWRPFTLEAAGHTFERRPGVRTWPADEPLTTLHGTASKALAVPLEGRDGKHALPMSLPGRTQTCRHETGLVVPSGGTWNDDARPTDDAHRAFTTRESYGLVMTNSHHNRCRPVDEALPTLTTATTQAMLEPFVAELRGGHSDARPSCDPLSTVTAGGNHHALVAPYYSGSDHAQPVDEPIGTLTTHDRYALVMRNNGAKGGNPARHVTPASEYLRTLTAEGPIPSLLMRNNTERGRGGEMSTPTSEPMRTLTTAGHQSLITPGDIAAAEAMVDDCLFRMLEPHEVAAGMAFPADYIWSGTRRVRVKHMGNAVTPPAARDLIGCALESMGEAA